MDYKFMTTITNRTTMSMCTAMARFLLWGTNCTSQGQSMFCVFCSFSQRHLKWWSNFNWVKFPHQYQTGESKKQKMCHLPHGCFVLGCWKSKWNVKIIDIKSIDFSVYDTMNLCPTIRLQHTDTETLAYIRGAVRNGTVHHQGVV